MYLRLLYFVTMDENIFTVIHNYEAGCIIKWPVVVLQWPDSVICNLIFYFTGHVRMKTSNLFALQKGHKVKLLIFFNLDFYGNICKI